MSRDVARPFLLILASLLSAAAGAQAPPAPAAPKGRLTPAVAAELRTMVRMAKANSGLSYQNFVLSFHKRFGSTEPVRWRDEKYVGVLSASVFNPLLWHYRQVTEAFTRFDDPDRIAPDDVLVLVVQPDSPNAPDITKIVLTQHGETLAPTRTIPKTVTFQNRFGSRQERTGLTALFKMKQVDPAAPATFTMRGSHGQILTWTLGVGAMNLVFE